MLKEQALSPYVESWQLFVQYAWICMYKVALEQQEDRGGTGECIC